MIDEHPHERGHSIRDDVYRSLHLGRRRTAGAASVRGSDDRTGRPTTADTLVAHEDEPRVPDASHYHEEGGVLDIGGPRASAQGEGRTKRTSSSSMLLPYKGQKEVPLDENQHSGMITHPSPPGMTVNFNLDTDYPLQIQDDYDSDAGNNNSANDEIKEVPRGRFEILRNGLPLPPTVRRTKSGSSLVGRSESPRRRSSPAISDRSPVFPSLIIPLSYSPRSHRSRTRPQTAPATPTSLYPPSPLAFVPPSRPGTADSIGSIRHHRLDFIRASDATTHGHGQAHRTPSTGDSSPSRSVRFVDYVDGETGHVETFGHG